MENIHQSIKIDDTIQDILEKLKPIIEKYTDYYHYDIYRQIHYLRNVYIIPLIHGKPLFTLRAKGGEYAEFNYYNTLDIYDLDIQEEPVERIWIPEFSPSDFEYYEEIQKIYQDETGIAVLYLFHVRKIVSETPLEYKDSIDDYALYYIFIVEKIRKIF
ncbi:MAG: hypothetical protein QXL84_06110 [Thermoplasmata archaeon]